MPLPARTDSLHDFVMLLRNRFDLPPSTSSGAIPEPKQKTRLDAETPPNIPASGASPDPKTSPSVHPVFTADSPDASDEESEPALADVVPMPAFTSGDRLKLPPPPAGSRSSPFPASPAFPFRHFFVGGGVVACVAPNNWSQLTWEPTVDLPLPISTPVGEVGANYVVCFYNAIVAKTNANSILFYSDPLYSPAHRYSMQFSASFTLDPSRNPLLASSIPGYWKVSAMTVLTFSHPLVFPVDTRASGNMSNRIFVKLSRPS